MKLSCRVLLILIAAALPDVPTTLEADYPDADCTFWNGIVRRFRPA